MLHYIDVMLFFNAVALMRVPSSDITKNTKAVTNNVYDIQDTIHDIYDIHWVCNKPEFKGNRYLTDICNPKKVTQ